MTQFKQDLMGEQFPGQKAYVILGNQRRWLLRLLLSREQFAQVEWCDQGEEGIVAVFTARK